MSPPPPSRRPRSAANVGPSAAASTFGAVRHLARLGLRGWLLIGLLVGAAFLVDRFVGGSTPDPPTPAPGGAVVADVDRNGRDDRPGGGGSLPPDFGPPPADRPADPPPRTVPPRTEPAPPAETRPARTYSVVTVRFRGRGGEAVAQFDPGTVFARTDGKGLALAERLRGGETLKTTCGEPATVAAAKSERVADLADPPRCPPAPVEPLLERVTVLNFGNPVPAAAPGGELDLTDTLVRIAKGENFPHRNDGGVFGNREGRLPRRARGVLPGVRPPDRERPRPRPAAAGDRGRRGRLVHPGPLRQFSRGGAAVSENAAEPRDDPDTIVIEVPPGDGTKAGFLKGFCLAFGMDPSDGRNWDALDDSLGSALGGGGPPERLVHREVPRLPAGELVKYRALLDDLRAEFPGMLSVTWPGSAPPYGDGETTTPGVAVAHYHLNRGGVTRGGGQSPAGARRGGRVAAVGGAADRRAVRGVGAARRRTRRRRGRRGPAGRGRAGLRRP